MAPVSDFLVETRCGRVAGTESRVPGVRRFLGIPYAAPPVGALRWQPPQPPAAWRGVRPADRPGPRCIQHAPYGELEADNPHLSEDCLYLNVWAPGGAAALPVLFFIHGGEFFAGSGSEARYDGARLAARGCVVVTLNHRLGVFGFLSHPELSGESPSGTSGNYGLLDLMAGLTWVRENIAAFGGDAGCITVGGESAGSCAAHAFMTSPLTAGRFHRAIGESGAFFMSEPHAMEPLPHSANEELGVRFQETVGATDIAALRKRPGAELLHVWLTAKFPRFQPCIGDHVVPEEPADVVRAGRQMRVPLLAGWNAAEYGFLRAAPNRIDATAYRAAMTAQFGPGAEDLWQAALAASAADPVRAVATLSGDRAMAYPTWTWLGAHGQTAPAYAYRFDRAPPGSSFGATHACELEYVFETPEARPYRWTADDYTLSRRIGDHWVAFLRSGDPNIAGAPYWPRYTDRTSPVMRLDVAASVAPPEEAARFALLERLYAARVR